MIISSFDSEITAQFHGWCFQNADLIVGNNGYQEFRRGGGQVSGGLDGCYVIVEESTDGWRVSTDSKGLGRIFVFRAGTSWAISNSLYELVKYLRDMGFKIKPRWSQLYPHAIRGAFTNQMTTSLSVVEDVELAPARSSVLITSQGVRIYPVTGEESNDYVEALRDYLAMWSSRLLTVATDERLQIGTDLTGGLDSRTVFGFFLLGDRHSKDLLSTTPIASSLAHKEDLAVATQLSEHYGASLNSSPPVPQTPRSERYAIDSWKRHSLGVYLPVYFYKHSLDPYHIRGHGAGGAYYRPYYKSQNINDHLKKYQKKLPAEVFSKWEEEAKGSLEKVSSLYRNVNEMIVYWREYRNRFHFGHRPHSALLFMPLNTHLLDRAEGDERLAGNQVYYDIMENLHRGLASHPFDTAPKNIGPEEMAAVTRVAFERDVTPGRIYFDEGDKLTASEGDSESAPHLWAEMGEMAIKREEVRDVIGEDILSRCKAEIDNIRETGSVSGSHSRSTVDLSFALMVDFALG